MAGSAPCDPGNPWSLWASVYLSEPPIPVWSGLSPLRPLHPVSTVHPYPHPLQVCALRPAAPYAGLSLSLYLRAGP